MASKEVLLLQPVANLGNEGETVSVKAGYARNFLLPRKLALPLTQANRKQVESLRQRREARLAQELGNAQALAAQIESKNLVFAVKTGEGGKMFGSITAQDLIDRLAEEGITIDKKRVSLYTPAKALGQHETSIRLHPEVKAELKFEIVSENPIED
jgi:large subunit ribosomal protein L9